MTIIRAYTTINWPKEWVWSILLSNHHTFLSGNISWYVLKSGKLNEHKLVKNIEINAFTYDKTKNNSMLSRESVLYVDLPCFSKIIMIIVTSTQIKMTLRQFNRLNKQMSEVVYLNDSSYNYHTMFFSVRRRFFSGRKSSSSSWSWLREAWNFWERREAKDCSDANDGTDEKKARYLKDASQVCHSSITSWLHTLMELVRL